MKRLITNQLRQLHMLTASARAIGFWTGPILFALIYFFVKPEEMNPQAITVSAITVWIAIWWVTEAVPLPVTSLLPIILFPLLGILSLSTTTSSYGDPIVFLYIGGFLLAIAIEKTGLHQRIALNIIRGMGTKLSMIILGFMISTGFISMWISNTATAIMMLPIGLAVIRTTSIGNEKDNPHFSKALMLSIAYAASIGGLGTLIGTPPNIVFAGLMKEMYNTDISFIQWFMIGFPIAVLLTVASWWYLTHIAYPLGSTRLTGEQAAIGQKMILLGPVTKAERRVAVVFVCVAVAWIIRSFVLQKWIPSIDDTIIAMMGGVILFLLPSGEKKAGRLLNWDDASKLPWGIILLFGGGLAIAEAFEATGLALWIGNNMTGLSLFGTFALVLFIVAIVNFLTEFTSNLATVTMILPVLAPIAVSAGIHPFMLMVGATLAASCGFMMPAGTPPNAIAFGSGYLSIWDMVKNGFWLNIVSVIIITCVIYFMLGPIWDLR